MEKLKLTKQGLIDMGQVVRPFLNFYLIDRSYVSVEVSIIGRVLGLLWVLLVLPIRIIMGVFTLMGLFSEWVDSNFNMFPSWYRFPFRKVECTFRVDNELERYMSIIKRYKNG